MNITLPDIPQTLGQGEAGQLTSHAELERLEFTALNLTAAQLSNLSFRETRLDKCLLPGARLERFFAKDVVIKGSDLTTAKCAEATLSQTRLLKCRIDGADLSGAELKDVIFEECKLDLVNFRFTKFKRVQFINCSLKETDYLSAQLDEVDFKGCTIDQTNFDQVTAKKMDLSDSELISLIGWQSLKGATIDSLQLLASAAQIVTALGLRVRD